MFWLQPSTRLDCCSFNVADFACMILELVMQRKKTYSTFIFFKYAFVKDINFVQVFLT